MRFNHPIPVILAIVIFLLVLFIVIDKVTYYESRIDSLDATVKYYRSMYYESIQQPEPPHEIRVPNS